MTRPRPARLLALGACLPVAAGLTLAASPAIGSAPADATLDVATTGKDSNAGTAAAPLKTVQAAIDKAQPGTTIRVHKGTYSQQLIITKSGTAAAPITIQPAGDGPVTLTSTQPRESCNSRIPSPNRTILIQKGSDYWTFKDMSIVNGIYLNGGGGHSAYLWHDDLADKAQWEPRRAVPGASRNDPAGAKTVATYLKNLLGVSMNPADHIEIIGNKLTKRGIHANFAWYGKIQNNTIIDIECGTGPGVWIITFSQFWDISGNDVSRIATSGNTHFMQEGIRLGTASNYNVVARNKVHDLGDDGRGIATDVDASFNIFENNVVTNVPIGYNDEMSGWGNIWRNNKVSRYTHFGYGFRLKDSVLRTPSLNSSTNMTVVSGNVASEALGNAKALGIGAVKGSSFSGNTFARVSLGPYVRGYWAAEGNTWNGTTQPPPR